MWRSRSRARGRGRKREFGISEIENIIQILTETHLVPSPTFPFAACPPNHLLKPHQECLQYPRTAGIGY